MPQDQTLGQPDAQDMGKAPEQTDLAPVTPAPSEEVETLKAQIEALQQSNGQLQQLVKGQQTQIESSKAQTLSDEESAHYQELLALEAEAKQEAEADELEAAMKAGDLDALRQREREKYQQELEAKEGQIEDLRQQVQHDVTRSALLRAATGKAANPLELAAILESGGTIKWDSESQQPTVIDPETGMKAFSAAGAGYMSLDEAVEQYVAENPHHSPKAAIGTGAIEAATGLPDVIGDNGDGEAPEGGPKLFKIIANGADADLEAPAVRVMDESMLTGAGTSAADKLISIGLTDRWKGPVLKQAVAGTLPNPLVEGWQRNVGAQRSPQPPTAETPTAGNTSPVQALRDAQAAKRATG